MTSAIAIGAHIFMMVSQSTSNLAATIRQLLPSDFKRPARSRLLWLPVHWAVVLSGLFLLNATSAAWQRATISVLMGFSFAGLAFVAHEALHGALSTSARLNRWVGFLGFMPFLLSPRLWLAWHNRVHHNGTNELGRDPDALPNLNEHQTSFGARASTWIQVHSGGLLTLIFGFSVQSLHILAVAARRRYLSLKEHRRAILDSLLAFVAWGALFASAGFPSLFWGYLLPLMIGNCLVMMHIVTNHGLSPVSENGDQVPVTLTVTVPRWFSFYTLGFGFHTEHHLLPGLSHRAGPHIAKLLQEYASESYRSMPLGQALRLYFRQCRVYEANNLLWNPRNGEHLSTLGPDRSAYISVVPKSARSGRTSVPGCEGAPLSGSAS
jgi:fatty acid desaturase